METDVPDLCRPLVRKQNCPPFSFCINQVRGWQFILWHSPSLLKYELLHSSLPPLFRGPFYFVLSKDNCITSSQEVIAYLFSFYEAARSFIFKLDSCSHQGHWGRGMSLGELRFCFNIRADVTALGGKYAIYLSVLIC